MRCKAAEAEHLSEVAMQYRTAVVPTRGPKVLFNIGFGFLSGISLCTHVFGLLGLLLLAFSS